MSTMNTRLKAARIAAGYKTAREAWEKYNWNPNTYRVHEAGPREIGKANAIDYAAAFGVPLMWLLTGLNDTPDKDNNSLPTGPNPAIGSTIAGAQIGLRVVPLVGDAAYGAMSNSVHKLAELATGFVAVADHGLSDDVFAYRIDDKSMEGAAPQALTLGDVVIVDRLAPIDPGHVVIAGLPTGKIAVRIYSETPNITGAAPLVTLIPVNSFFAQTTHERDALAFLYRVVVVQRRL